MQPRDHIEPSWWRRFYVGWALFAVLYGGIEASSFYMEGARFDVAMPLWRVIVNEYTGIYALVVLLPLIRRFDGLFPIRGDTWHYSVPAHLLATVPFGLAHVGLFVAARKVLHPLFGGHYELGDLAFELVYEYRKIALGYGLALCSLYAFRHYVQLRRLLDMPEADTGTTAEVSADAPAATPAGAQRFLARRAHRDVMVSVADVHYVEAAGNYVILHTDEGELKLRRTLSHLERELADFVRVHRSYLVNLDAVREIQPWFHGDQRILLRDGTFLNLSRRYRDALRQHTAALPGSSRAQSRATG